MEHQHLEDDYLYEDEDALSELRELRSKIDYCSFANKTQNIRKQNTKTLSENLISLRVF